MIRFFSIVLIILIYTVFKACQLWPEQPYLASALTIVLFSIMLLSQFAYRSQPKILGTKWFEVLAWVGALLMGLWGSFILLSIAADLVRLVVAAFIDQNTFFTPNFYLAMFAVACVITIIGFIQVLRGPCVKQISIQVPNLNADLVGLKIAQISDLHVGPTIRTAYVQQVVNRTNATNPDLIFVTGDLADAKANSITQHLAPLADLKSRFGIFYVTGNHEYYWDATGLIEATRKLGFIPLINDNKIIEIKHSKILIAGVTDPVGTMLKGHSPDINKAAHSQHKTQLKILLAHRPEACFEAEPLGFDLQFSGHTHAGQFFPFNILVSLVHKYYKGLNKHGRLWLYVNPGTGYWGAANRFGISSEISLITLTS